MTSADIAFYRRMGRLDFEREPGMRMSRARQICRTWRSHLAWHLANALGWRGQPQNPDRPSVSRLRRQWRWRNIARNEA